MRHVLTALFVFWALPAFAQFPSSNITMPSFVISSGWGASDRSLLTTIDTSTAAAAATLERIEDAMAPESTFANAVLATGAGILGEAKDFDGSALPNVVTEGQASRVALTLSGGMFTFLTNEAGTKELGKHEEDVFTGADYGMPVWARRIDAPAPSAAAGRYGSVDSGPEGGVYTQPIASSVGGATGHKRTSVGTTEDEHEIKATAGTLYSITVTNTNAAARYLRCANLTAANTTPGTSTPILDLAIPGQAAGAGFTSTFPVGFAFSTALTCWMVTGAADTDVAEVAANEIKVLYTFK